MLKKAVVAAGMLLFFVNLAYAEVKLKIAVANPSTTEAQETAVKFDLPRGIDPENIFDIGGMELKYDFNTATYYVYKKIVLQPSEKRIFEVKLRDIWSIPETEIETLKKHNDALMDKLKNSKHSATGVELYKKINSSLDDISKKQDEVGLLTKDRINLYYENVRVLSDIKKDIGMLENLVLDIGGIVEDRVELPATMAVPLSAAGADYVDTVELTITASNPSDKTKEINSIRYALPEEVIPKYIVDNGGLDIEYDFKKECFYLYKDAVELNPGETKTYAVRIQDIWKIPPVELEALSSHTKNLMLLLKGTEFFAQAEPIEEKINAELDNIKRTQEMEASASEHIAYFRANTAALGEVKKSVAQLEKLASQSGATPGVTIARAERLKGGGPEVTRRKGYEGITLLAESIFRAKAPSIATTWKIIWIIVIFLALLSVIFFLVQLAYHRRMVVDSLTGAYSRSYFLEKLEEELAACRQNNKEGFLFMLDIDNFKYINDTYGHEGGDTTLRHFASVLQKAAHGGGFLGRIGGDEFLFFVSSVDRQKAAAVAEEMRKAVSEERIGLRGRNWNITSTIGIAAVSKGGEAAESSDVLIRKADGAMYQGKSRGGNVVVIG